MLRILHSQWMEPKNVAENLEVGVAGLVKVEPKKTATGEQALDRGAIEPDLLGAVRVDDITHRRASAIPTHISRPRTHGSARLSRPIGR
jgi:hypothetical protein